MNRRKLLLTAISLAIASLLWGCTFAKEPFSPAENPLTLKADISLTFISQSKEQSDTLVIEEERTIAYESQDYIESYVLEELFVGPKTAKGINIIPSNLSVKKIEKSHGATLVLLSFDDEKPKETFDFMLVKTSIALTLLKLPQIDAVGVYLDEIEYDSNGQPRDLFEDGSVLLPNKANGGEEKHVTLYLPDLKNNTLIPKTQSIVNGNDNSQYMSVVTELFKVTDNANSTRTLYNQNARVLSVLKQGNVVSFNFSEEIEGANATSEQINLCIYGLVNSVCTLEGVTEVELFIKGKSYDSYLQYTQGETFLFQPNLVSSEAEK